MRWLSISAVSSTVGYVGWKIGSGLISSTGGLWISFFASIAGMWVAMMLFPKQD